VLLDKLFIFLVPLLPNLDHTFALQCIKIRGRLENDMERLYREYNDQNKEYVIFLSKPETNPKV